jgi:hypothetical protein
MYECLEAGTIPLYVRNEGDESFWRFISKVGLLNIESWEKAKEIIQYFIDNPNSAETYRRVLIKKWNDWKCKIRSDQPSFA